MVESVSCTLADPVGTRCTDEDGEPTKVRGGIDPSWRARMILENLRVDSARLSASDREAVGKTIAEMIRRGCDDRTVLFVARGLMCLGRSKEEMGLDCSGFVKDLCARNGSPLTSRHIWAPGSNGCTKMVRSLDGLGPDAARTGDLVFFNFDQGARTATHVGIVVASEDGSLSVLHMTEHGVKLNRLWDADGHRDYWGNRSPVFSRNPALD